MFHVPLRVLNTHSYFLVDSIEILVGKHGFCFVMDSTCVTMMTFFLKKRRLFKGNRGRDLHYDIIVIGRSNFAAPILIVLKQLEAMVTSKSAAKV